MSSAEDYSSEALRLDDPFTEVALLMHELSPSINPDIDPIACLENAREFAAELNEDNVFVGREISFLLDRDCKQRRTDSSGNVIEAGGYVGLVNSFCVIKDADHNPDESDTYWLGVKISLEGEGSGQEVLLPAHSITGVRLSDGHNIFESEHAIFQKHVPSLIDSYFEPPVDHERAEPLAATALAEVVESSSFIKSGGYVELVFANTVGCSVIGEDGNEVEGEDPDEVLEFNIAAGAIKGILRGFRVIFETQDDATDEVGTVIKPVIQATIYPQGEDSFEFAEFALGLPIDKIVDSRVLQLPSWN